MEWKIPWFKTYSDEKDVEAVTNIIRRGSFWAIGKEIEEFEERVAKYIGQKYALAFNSGTSALHILLLSNDIKGKEVIVPSFTFIATANAVILAGGKPIFAETETETGGLDVGSVKEKITKNTKAIIALHYAGFPSRDILKLKKLAEENNLLLIEDAAQAFGAKVGEKKVGSIGDSSMFSLCQSKIITTGEGGIMLTDSKEVYENAKLFRSHGRVELQENYFCSPLDPTYTHIGYNLRMPTMLAALGLSQLEKVDFLIKKRRELGHFFTKELAKTGQIHFMQEMSGNFAVYQMYPIILNDKKTRDSLQKYLEQRKIFSKAHFQPIHLKEVYKKKYGQVSFPTSEDLYDRILCIPFYPSMNYEEKELLIKTILDFLK